MPNIWAKVRTSLAWKKIPGIASSFAADAMTLFSSGIVSSVLARGIELYLIDINKKQFAYLFILHNVPRVLGSSYQRKLLVAMRERFVGNSKNFAKLAFVEGMALSIYGIPIYAISAVIVGMPLKQIIFMSVWFLVTNILIDGWIYGKVLDLLRSSWGWARGLM